MERKRSNIRPCMSGDKSNRSSYLMMLNNITNDLDILLSEFCNLSYPDSGEPPPCDNQPMKPNGKKPMHFENCSAFGGSSTSGTLTSTDSNHSNKDVASGTLTSTDSNNSVTKARTCSVHSSQLDDFGTTSSKALELPAYPPDKQASPSRSTSGSDLRQISVLERLTKTHPIWYLPTVGRSGAVHLLKNRDIGIFIVRKSSREDIMALSVQFPSTEGTQNVDHYLIEPTEHGLHLQGSNKLFSAIPNLIAHYCDNKEDLPHQLVLPPSIAVAKTSQELTALAMLGQDFWTSSKYEGNSRCSSRSNLSDQSSVLNKSASEPISINKCPPVPAYSHSETLMQNTPPKPAVIDFSSYLIQNKKSVDSVDESKATMSQTLASVTESVHSKCSVSHTSSHMSNRVTTIDFSILQQRDFQSKMTLHESVSSPNLEPAGKRESRMSVPYAKPNKGLHKERTASYCSTAIELLHIPDDFYFTSNLSDKLSDYEDIWKNNYADPKVGSVQKDLQQRLQPNLMNNNSSGASDQVDDTSNSAEDADTKVCQEECFNGKCVVKDLNVSLDKLSSLAEVKTLTTSASVEMSRQCEVSETEVTCTAHIPEHVVVPSDQTDSIDVILGETESVCEEVEEEEVQEEDQTHYVPNKHAVFDTIPENESDIDTCHSDCCHSDGDADADTEEDSVPKIASVQTQTSPLWKLKSPPFCNVGRKSVSTSSLSTIRSPVYAEPFDAINNGEKKKGTDAPKLPKKMRRRSAPAIGQSKRKLSVNECKKFSPLIASPLEEDCSVEVHDSQVENLKNEPESSGEPEEVFEMSQESNVDNTQEKCEDNHQYETAWPDNSRTGGKPAKVKPRPLPRHTTKCVNKSEETNRKTFHEVANRIERLKQQTLEKEKKLQQKYNSDMMEHFFEEFDINHNPSSPTLNKFPVFQTQTSNDTNIPAPESTAEDMICSYNPELTLRPLRPFPVMPVNAPSEYDNLNNVSYLATSGLSVASAGTVFCKPWENSVVGKIMNTGPHSPHSPHTPVKFPPPVQAPPPLPPQIDMLERIKAWQESSQKYQTYVMEDEVHLGFSDVNSISARTFGAEKSSTYDFNVSSNEQTSQSMKTPINDKCGAGTPDVTGPIYGMDFRDKVAPILANPRLLKKPERNRNPDKHIRDYIMVLSKDRTTTFGSTIENFIQCTLESSDTNPFNITRNVRQFMNGIKNYLVKHGEGELEDLIERERSQLGKDEILNIDAILETSLHECVIQPLKQFIYRLFVNEYTRNGTLKLLSSNIKYARTKTPDEIGIRKGLALPDGVMLENIKHFLSQMQKSYSPVKKLENLLGATSTIYKCVTSKLNKGKGSHACFGADDFLPMLIYVLVQCGTVSVEIEADYMWGLLHPSLLTGEGGYYLTSLSSAVLVLKNFRQMQETSASQLEGGHLPSISDMQGFMKIAIPDEQRDTIMWQTLPVRPSMTTRDVCAMIAHKFKITNPQDYGLYTLESGEECKMMDMECPQMLKVDRLAHKKECIFAYKRNAANIAWPKSVK